jgi:ABC-type uncharacterized transport system substrate-binding protein
VTRREFIGLLGSAASWPFTAHAQQLEKVARVGFLRQAGPHAKQFDAFRDGLRAAGYVEGRNLLIEQRYATGAYERLFAAIADWRAEGLLTLADGMLFSQREQVVELALKNKLPGVYPEAEFVAAGGLASYGPSLPELFRQAAGYVDKILKGAKPADLPIEQPSKFELVVNLKTAQALGLPISRDFQLRADEVIE